ncbi:MAG: ATP-dependent DNA helicase RecG [Gammaproteobacteria bacterium]|nr:ATP-dependent DNA helicase RecG [Gammaproteobacteria bacterium]
MNVDPHLSIDHLKGVGPKLQQSLERLGIYRYIDLLLHLPQRYQDRTKLTPLGHIRAGDECFVEGRIKQCVVLFGKRRSLKVTIEDETGEVHLRFFHFSRYQQNKLNEAHYVRAYGEFRFFGKELSAAHPQYESFDDPPEPPIPTLTPIYPTTQGLAQGHIRRLQNTLGALPWSQQSGTPFDKLKFLHQPPADTDFSTIDSAREDIAFDELTAFYLVMKGRALRRQQEHATGLPRSAGKGRVLLQNLGFHLTQAQARVVSEVLNDLELAVPMLRLVQGDVGSGKTVVAAFAAIRAAEQNCQTALMAPTELLAEQHFINFQAWLQPLGISTILLTGQLSTSEQRSVLQSIEHGHAKVVIGTHALFQQKVIFNNLVLAIIDEQHRFGVHQRMSLQHKGKDGRQPHQLIMTATPIPRTLTMALYADMAVSVIDELPKGRQPITTHTVEEGNRGSVIDRADVAIESGQQVYWVCTLIDDSDEIDAVSATHSFSALTESLPSRSIGLLHGRMKSQEKIAVMEQFKRGEIQLLVATTVVEVGVDVPNATLMVIENAERLGLAQLHQLRGRVGRGSKASHCFLIFTKGLSEGAKTRLIAMRESQDGFYLAEQDLKLRGPGDILGTRQSGEQNFRIADLGLHAHLMPRVIARGDELLAAPAANLQHAVLNELLNTWAPADSGHLTV